MAFPSVVRPVWYLSVISRPHILFVPLTETQYGYLGAICWVQSGQLYVLNDTQPGLLLRSPFRKTGVTSDQRSVYFSCLLSPLSSNEKPKVIEIYQRLTFHSSLCMRDEALRQWSNKLFTADS